MDVVIPSHAVKTFCSSLSSLSKMGPDVYWEFEVMNGLTLRTINDAKSAYGCWHYEAKFFERCTVPTTRRGKKRRRREDATERFTGRMASRSLQPLLRSRKAASLRITTAASSGSRRIADDDDDDEEDTMIIFCFSIEYSTDVVTSIQFDIPLTTQTETLCAVPNMTDASSLVAAPVVLWRLLEALSASNYVALIVRNNSSVAASSFTTADSSDANDTLLLPGSHHRSKGLLKSETACDIEDLLDFDFVSNRDTLLGNNADDKDDEDMPDTVNQEVILVFHVPEAKAFLQFATSVAASAVHVSFHWGGKPALLEVKADTYSARVVLATLDHATLTAQRTMMEQQQQQQQQRTSSQERSGGQ